MMMMLLKTGFSTFLLSDIRTASSSIILLLHAHYCATAHKWTALKSWTERRTAAAGKMVQKNVIQSSA